MNTSGYKLVVQDMAIYKCAECGIMFVVNVSGIEPQKTLPCHHARLSRGGCNGVAFLHRTFERIREVRKTAEEMFGTEGEGSNNAKK